MRLIRKLLSIVLISVSAIACEKLYVDEPANNPEAIFENLWQTFNENYAPFEERKVDWSVLYNTYRPLVSSQTHEDSLFAILAQMLSHLDDGHVSLTAPDREIFYSNRIRREKVDDELFSLDLIKNNYLNEGWNSDEDESYLYGLIEGANIGYIYFAHISDNMKQLNNLIADYNDVAGYIIDFRHNEGGDFTYTLSEMGRLVDTKRLIFSSKTKTGKGRNDFSEWTQYHVSPSGRYINKPLVVLTDRYTISAGERSVMAFKVLPNVISIGDTTNGAHGTMIGGELANGWYYSLVTQKVIMSDGISYEGVGIAPDIYVKNQPAQMLLGMDETLEAAIDQIVVNMP